MIKNKRLRTVAQWLAKLRIRRGYWPFAFGLLLTLIVGGTPVFADLYDAAMATVRVRCGNGVGSGIVVGANDQAYYALTNAHVADRSVCTVEFFSEGKMSAQVTGCQTVSRDPQNDVAVVQIDKRKLSGHVPAIIPIDPAYEMRRGDPICSVGHPHGENPTAFVGGYVGKTADGSITFRPPPAQGRSGSALFDRDFTRVVGLIWGCDTDKVKDRLGYGVPAARFATALGKELAKIQVAHESPIHIDAEKQVAFYDSSAPNAELSILNRKPAIRNPDRTPLRDRLKDRREIRREQRQGPSAEGETPNPEPTIPDNLQTSEKTAIKIEIGDVSLGIEKPSKEPPKPVPPKSKPRPMPPMFPPPVPPRPMFPPPPRPFGPPFGVVDVDDVELCQYSPYGYYSAGSCPNGSCPSESAPVQVKPPALKPSKPIPTGPSIETTLPDPDAVKDTPRPLTSGEIPVAIAPPDPRLEKIPEIEKTVLGLRDGQSGIDRKVDQALEKVGQLIDAKKDAVKVDLELFRADTLQELDTRVWTLRAGIDERLANVQTQLATLEQTNERISELKESIDNFSVFPSAGGLVAWLQEWGWFLLMLVTIAALGGIQGWQIYKQKRGV